MDLQVAELRRALLVRQEGGVESVPCPVVVFPAPALRCGSEVD
jgi:hypothetical protein